ncbi:hypothetical protein EI94DRAFT_1715275 [Lactarius quietus]|nr:hypothetical protein EI94DRAFT_1715275 [Lactarius quietus]
MSNPPNYPSRRVPISPQQPPTMSNPPSKSPSPSPDSKEQSPTSDKDDAGVAEASESNDNVEPTSTSPPSSGNWQAIWSPAHSAYYFYNTTTQETTWVNPLQPAAGEPSSSSSSQPASASASATPPNAQEGAPSGSSSGATHVPASVAQIYALQEAAAAQGIDPSLAHLDPTLAGPSAPNSAYSFSARFNAHTGTFTKPDGRDPTHLSEYERMKRMSSVYFNMEQWEQDVAQRNDEEEENGKKRKRPTKKDLERFKEQKRLKKIAKTAWLRT